uniref:Cytochrome b-c1 complex subunit 10 n=1 Tax=Laticauda laticaudata TaxID=8630 RepID=A0A8C5SWI6_LATLA
MNNRALADHYLQIKHKKGTYVLWATSAVIGGVWLTDWKVILGYVPWINGKFKEDE